MHIYEIRLDTDVGGADYRITAPSIAHVIAYIAEEDKDELAREDVVQLTVRRVRV